ncbi:nucleotidyltransferase family protein [Marinobacter zhejiangensis]|uniref:Molybdenum cofactor cytidylyltransferase n=1 Tax=Marinobacter zhejiangensis TaxID=488535 RepID=A0A1I4NW12_9GAMM|nr:nucleotidyltransferase family protein [Marinobacter zhejiangensis]SFM19313.1 molybdenum cofactor cytidylyltransferase [Marinobacter zhejiangensis]
MTDFRALTPVIVLAAGASERMGRSKQLLGWGQGCLLDQAVALARNLSSDVVVVAGARYPVIRYRATRSPSRWVVAADWHKGMGASLNAGLRSLPARCRGAFVMVADQPVLALEGLQALADAARAEPGRPVAADYGGRPGVPAYLPRALWAQVSSLTGDQGAGAILNRVNARRIRIAGVELDLDTPADLKALRGR